jgi:multisubunit Na+/H+ antiporter MnhG subunit
MDQGVNLYLEARKKYLKPLRRAEKGFNDRVAVTITNTVGTMWCAYAFACLALISLPDAIRAGTAALIIWIAQTFLQLVLLSIIMVGQKVASEKSDRQLEQTYRDAEALLKLNGDMHVLLKENNELTRQINKIVSHDEKGS